MSILITALVFLLMISVLVFAHELGHFLFARWCGMDVEEFSIGLGRPKWTIGWRKGTEYSVRLWPVGGFVRIKGMVPEENGSEIHVEGGFYSKPAWKRLIVLFAGPLFSILFGVLVLFGSLWAAGDVKPIPVIGAVVAESAAAKAGLLPGDRIVSVQREPVKNVFDAMKILRDRPNMPTMVEFEHQGKVQTAILTPAIDPVATEVLDENLNPTGEMRAQGRIGVRWQTINGPLPPGEALAESVKAPAIYIASLYSLFFRTPDRIASEVGGPIAIASLTSQAIDAGLLQVIRLSAFLSLSLGILNLLPIAPMDGGQMMIAFVELLRRNRRLSFSVQNAVLTVGLALVFMMFVGVLWLDLKRQFLPSDKTAKPSASTQVELGAKDPTKPEVAK